MARAPDLSHCMHDEDESERLGRADRGGLGLKQLMITLPDGQTAECRSGQTLWTGERRCAKPMPYWCSDRRSYFSVRMGTVNAHSKLPLRQWVTIVTRARRVPRALAGSSCTEASKSARAGVHQRHRVVLVDSEAGVRRAVTVAQPTHLILLHLGVRRVAQHVRREHVTPTAGYGRPTARTRPGGRNPAANNWLSSGSRA